LHELLLCRPLRRRVVQYTREYPSPISSYIDAYTSIRDSQDQPIAAGHYSIDLQTAYTGVTADHVVSSAVYFLVKTCTTENGSHNFQ
jgi:hypothetical protein